MPRPQFALQALLVLTFGAACFFGGIHFERERRRRENEAMAPKHPVRLIDANYWPQATTKDDASPFK